MPDAQKVATTKIAFSNRHGSAYGVTLAADAGVRLAGDVGVAANDAGGLPAGDVVVADLSG